MTERLLLADLGGTNTRVGLGNGAGLITDSARSFSNADFDSLTPLLQAYLSDIGTPPITALCAGVAGPVNGEAAQLTNHDWMIKASALREATGATEVRLLNDLQAQGYALDDLTPDSVTSLFPGAATSDDATRLVLGLGTGCNVAVVHRTSLGLLVPAAESGHTHLPHCDGNLGKLITHLGQSHAHRPIESALSGPGLQNIYHWVTGSDLPADQIIVAAIKGDTSARKAIDLFTQLLGTVAGDLALTHLPMGGIFLIGGLARAIAPFLADSGFHAAFTAKGPYTAIAQDIPVLLIKDDMAALRGCARYLRQEMTQTTF
ncbi:ROK family protein [Roseovarius sp. 2305UL8-3]|uniref:glucokinase n=1 Tax=Roseovarius conchicola TaxID=3121636 RepID=UPI003528446B